MKTPSSELHELIQSLSSAEKRYVRRMAMDQDTSFLKLMDAIAEQKTYDETKLKQDFKKEKFVKNLAVNKKYLSDYLLNSLVQFRRKEEESSILHGISMVVALEEKELPGQALKMIHRLKKKADDLGLYSLVFQLLELEKWNAGSDVNARARKEIYEKGKEIYQKIDNIHEYWNIYTQVCKEESETLLRYWLDNSLLLDFKYATSVESQLYYYETKAIIYTILGEVEDAFLSNWNYLGILDKNPKYMSRFSEKYLSILSNLLGDALSLGKRDVYKAGIAQMKALTDLSTFKSTPYTKAKVFRQVNLLELNDLLQSNQIGEGINKLAELEVGLNLYEDKISLEHRFELQYLAACFLFKDKQYQAAQDWVKPLLQYHQIDILPEILQASRILNLITHVELGTDKKTLSLIKTSRRYIKQSRSLDDTEKHLFDFLMIVVNAKNIFEIKVGNIKLLEALVKLKIEAKVGQLSRFLDILGWCESRMFQNEEVVKEIPVLA